MFDNSTCIPSAVGQKLLQVSGLGIGHDLFHAIHVLARAGLHRPTSILAGFLRYIMTVGLKVVAETFHEGRKAPADPGERRLRGSIQFSPLIMDLSVGGAS